MQDSHKNTNLEIIIHRQRTYWGRSPGNHYKTKERSKMPLSSFYVGHIPLGMVPALKNGLCPGEISS